MHAKNYNDICRAFKISRCVGNNWCCARNKIDKNCFAFTCYKLYRKFIYYIITIPINIMAYLVPHGSIPGLNVLTAHCSLPTYQQCFRPAFREWVYIFPASHSPTVELWAYPKFQLQRRLSECSSWRRLEIFDNAYFQLFTFNWLLLVTDTDIYIPSQQLQV